MDGDDVFGHAVGDHIVGDVIAEGAVSIGVIAHMFSVDIDVAVHIDAVKVNGDALSSHGSGDDPGLAVPGGAAVQEAAAGLGLGAQVKVLLNAVIMGQVQRPPVAVIEVGRFGAFHLAQMEGPVLVEVEYLPAGGLQSVFGVQGLYVWFFRPFRPYDGAGGRDETAAHRRRQNGGDHTLFHLFTS